jgi:hypothetical protein
MSTGDCPLRLRLKFGRGLPSQQKTAECCAGATPGQCTHNRRNFLHLAAGAAALPAMSRIARAQVYPTRPVRVICCAAPEVCVAAMASRTGGVPERKAPLSAGLEVLGRYNSSVPTRCGRSMAHKGARELGRATCGMNCRRVPVPFITYPNNGKWCRRVPHRRGLRERLLFWAEGQSRSDELLLDLFMNRLKPMFGAGRAVSEKLDLSL